MRTPSWNTSVAVPERLPGTMPPTSCQWAMMPRWAMRMSPVNTGEYSATS